jgi:hypothetical protein
MLCTDVYPTGTGFRSANRLRPGALDLHAKGEELDRQPSCAGDLPAHLSLDSNESKD